MAQRTTAHTKNLYTLKQMVTVRFVFLIKPKELERKLLILSKNVIMFIYLISQVKMFRTRPLPKSLTTKSNL